MYTKYVLPSELANGSADSWLPPQRAPLLLPATQVPGKELVFSNTAILLSFLEVPQVDKVMSPPVPAISYTRALVPGLSTPQNGQVTWLSEPVQGDVDPGVELPHVMGMGDCGKDPVAPLVGVAPIWRAAGIVDVVVSHGVGVPFVNSASALSNTPVVTILLEIKNLRQLEAPCLKESTRRRLLHGSPANTTVNV